SVLSCWCLHVRSPCSTLFPYTTLFRSLLEADIEAARQAAVLGLDVERLPAADFPITEPLSMDRVVLLRDMARPYVFDDDAGVVEDRKSTRLNSSHVKISYAVFCLKKKK